MKKLIISIVLSVAVVVAGYFGYQQFFGNDIATQIANKVHEEAPMLDKSLLSICAKKATRDLTKDEKNIVIKALGKEKTTLNGPDAMKNMQLSMTVFGEIMQCVSE